MDAISYNLARRALEKPTPSYSALVAKDGSTVWAEDASGKTIASGEAGVDDASVIQSVIDSLQEYEFSDHKGCFATVMLRGDFILKKKITITKSYIRFSGDAKIYVNIPNDFAFEVFNGSEEDAYPCWICFENLFFHDDSTEGSNLFNFRYSSNWQIKRCSISSFKTVLQLERTWGNAQLMDNVSILNARPSDNEGAIKVVQPSNDKTNSVIFRDVVVSLTNQNAFVFENDASDTWLIRFINCYHENKGGFFIFKKDAHHFKIYNGCLCQEGSANAHTYFIKSYDNVILDFFTIDGVTTRGHIDVYSLRRSWLKSCEFGDRFAERFTLDLPIINIRHDATDLRIISPIFGQFDKKQPMIYVNSANVLFIESVNLGNIHCGEYFLRTNPDNFSWAVYVRDCVIDSFAGNRSWTGSAYAFSLANGHFILDKCKFHGISADTYYPYDSDTISNLANIKIREVEAVSGWFTKNSGTATFSGDGTTTDFEIGAHGLVTTDPSKIAVKITPVSSDAIAASPCVGYVDPADNTKIRVKFASAPASGSNNVQIVWHAEVIS
ncbi:hypothetical protein DRN52_06425 [Thermococci archaeon]|nr:MAG: hypothetical protein DRN52_06425 [Thermococci archaeon]